MKEKLFEILKKYNIAHFFKSNTYNKREAGLYIMLKYLNDDELWIREYEKAVSNGIEPRERLQKQYQKKKKLQM